MRALCGIFFAGVVCVGFAVASRNEIIHGKEAKPHSRPYMAALFKNNRFFCGGFLIDDHFILTAAHCNRSNITVCLGAHNLSENCNMFQVNNIIPHEHYNNVTDENDIMLLKLAKPAKMKNVIPIRIPKTNTIVPSGQQCWATGWGKTDSNSIASDVLREVEVEIWDMNNCSTAWNHQISNNMICARGDGIKGTCYGDSGGPLVCGNEAVGIASFVSGNCRVCEEPNIPNVFTRVSAYLNWIDTIKNAYP